MFSHLQIYDRRERALVGSADAALTLVAPIARALRRPRPARPQRILLLRLERIGDLVMSLDAITDVSQAAPDANVDLVVGSWNRDLARAIPGITRVETVDARWLSRDGGGESLPGLLRRALQWRSRRYDLAINFEPDIRTNLLLAAAEPAVTAGFESGGGGALLDIALRYDPLARTSDNHRRLAQAALGVVPYREAARLSLPPDARRRAADLLGNARRPIVGIHPSGGRAIKQWDPERFAEVAARLAREQRATIVVTGTAADRPMVDAVLRAVPPSAVDLARDLDLLTLAAAIELFDVYVTGDTGPMHVAAAVGTPVVAIFGPSDPLRYAPADPIHRVVRIDLPCAPCNRIRLPPARCVGHTPDCLHGIGTGPVYDAAVATLAARARAGSRSA